MCRRLFFQHLLERTRPLIGLFFAVALKLPELLDEMERGENSNLQRIGGVGLSCDIVHSRVDLISQVLNLCLRERALQKDRVFLIINNYIDRSRSWLRQRF